MPDTPPRTRIDAPRDSADDLVATTDGMARWWTGRPLEGDSTVGSRFAVFFGDADTPAAVMEVQSDMADEIVWRVIEGPDSWIGTLITFARHPSSNRGTTLLVPPPPWAGSRQGTNRRRPHRGAYLPRPQKRPLRPRSFPPP